MSRLPQEIFDIIVKYLDGDQASLLSCSLVSMAWGSAARRLLFRSMNIGNGDTLQEFTTTLSANGSLRFCVKALTVRGYFENPQLSSSLERSEDFKTLTGVLDKLPNLQSLFLDEVMFISREAGSLCTSTWSIRKLSWKNEHCAACFDLDYQTQFIDILHLFHNVEHLTLHLLYLPNLLHIPLQTLPSSLHPKSLTLSYAMNSSRTDFSICNFLQSAMSFRELRDLTVDLADDDSLWGTGEIIRAAASSLHSLTLVISSGVQRTTADDWNAWTDRYLSPCSSLKSLHFRIRQTARCHSSDGEGYWSIMTAVANNALWRAIATMLSTISRSHRGLSIAIFSTLDSLTGVVSDTSWTLMSNDIWSPFSDALSESRELKSVRFVGRCTPGNFSSPFESLERFEAIVREHLGTFFDRGILKVEKEIP